jgi:prephenate dehydrogenase
MTRVTIVGTGLLGASMALGLKASKKLPNLEIVGSDRNRDHLAEARKLGAIDIATPDPAEAVRGAAMVVVAVPVLGIEDVLHEIAGAVEEGAVVTDTGSTKTEVMRWARAALPEAVSFVGGHPMAGTTASGPATASADLFKGAQWVVVPSVGASDGAVQAVAGMATSLGASARFMDAEEHDAYVAAISHLPLAAATALFRLARDSEAWPELSVLAAGGFRDTTRVAGTHPDMAHDIAVTNRTQLIHWIERYRESLRELQERIADVEGEEDLYRLFATTSIDHGAFMAGKVGRVEVDQKGMDALPENAMADFIFGSYFADKIREINQRSEDRLKQKEQDRRMRRER